MLMIWGDVVGLLAGVALTAISGGGIQSLATTLTGDLVSREQRGRAIGLLQTSNDLGSAIGPPLAYALMGVIALSGVYVLCAILFGVGLGLSVYYMRPRAS
jgi:MFS family permease